MADTLHIRGPWTSDRIAIAHVIAVLPPLAVAVYLQGAPVISGFAVALAVTFLWQIVFARSRHSPIGWDGIVTAAAFIVLLPAPVRLWQIALALTFGVVLGEQIFGGRGRAFLHPAAVGLGFLFFSFPASATGAASPLLGLAAIPGAALLVALGLASWRIIVAALAGLAAAAVIAGSDNPLSLLASGAFVLALVFLGCDPVSSAATNMGRLIYGVLIGIFTVALGSAGAAIESSTAVFAVLLASIFAPAVDRGVIFIHAQQMRRRRA